jgi:hypothetical protein
MQKKYQTRNQNRFANIIRRLELVGIVQLIIIIKIMANSTSQQRPTLDTIHQTYVPCFQDELHDLLFNLQKKARLSKILRRNGSKRRVDKLHYTLS